MQRKHPRIDAPSGPRRGRNLRHFAGILWASPLTLFGLLLALPILCARGSLTAVPPLALAGTVGGRTAAPALLVRGRLGDFLLTRHPFGAMHAMAIGHIVIANRSATSRRLLVHELTHVAQAARWGLLFPLAYLAASARAYWRGGDLYWDNVFEIAAREAEQHA